MKLRVGFIAGALGGGGVERWLVELIRSVSSWATWIGVGVEGSVGERAEEMLGCRVHQGPDNCVRLAKQSDIILLFAPAFAHRYHYEAKTKLVFSWHGGPGPWASKHIAGQPVGLFTAIHAVGNHSASSFPEALRSRVIIVPNCADRSWIQPTIDPAHFLARHGIPDDVRCLAVIGRCSSEKRWHIAAGGIGSKSGCHALIAGGVNHSPEHDRVLPWFVREMLPNSTVVGWQRNIGDVLQCSAGIVSCSDQSEGCGLNLMEAALAGVPIISTPTGICADEPDLATITLPENPDTHDVFKAVHGLMSFDRSMIDQSVEQARQIIERKYNRFTWGKQWRAFLEGI